MTAEKHENEKSTNKAPFPTSIIFSILFFISFYIFLSLSAASSLLCLQWGEIKSCYSNKQGKNKKRKLCHPYREGGILTFFSRTERKKRWREAKKQRSERGLKAFISPLAGCYLNLKGCGMCRREERENLMELPGMKTVLKCTVNICLLSNVI